TASTRGRTAGGSSGSRTPTAQRAASRASEGRCRTDRSSTLVTVTRTAAPRWPPSACSRAAAWPHTSRSGTFRSSRSRRSSMSLPPFREPFDFALSTSRFQAFGSDLATRFVEGVLHRAVGGRDVAIAPAPGGADVEPLDEATRTVVSTLLGAPFDLS